MPQTLVASAVRGVSWQTIAENPKQPALPVSFQNLRESTNETAINDSDDHGEPFEALARYRMGYGTLKDTAEPEQEQAGNQKELTITQIHPPPDSGPTETEETGIGTGSADANRAEMEFSWELCLEELNAHPVPPEAFQHVADSLVNGLEEGQYLEYVYPSEGTKKFFWFIELIYARDSNVFVRYLGLENQHHEAFWLDLNTAEVFASNTCDKKIYQCRPPKVVMKYRAYLGDLLEKSKKGLPTPMTNGLAHHGRPLKDRIEEGQMLEVMDQQCGMTVWPAVVKNNIGGRLKLQYWKGGDEDVLWIFCTENRLRPLKFGKDSGYQYRPPSGVTLEENEITEVMTFVQEFSTSSAKLVPVPADAFSKFELPPAQFAKGDHVEVVHPNLLHQISPAVVTEIFPNQTVAVEILDFRAEDKKEKIVRIYNNDNLEILPIHWCKKNGIKLSRPPGWDPPTDREKREKDKNKEKKEKPEFTWQKIVDDYGGTMASQKCFGHLTNLDNLGFSRGMKLEMSNPADPEEICMATILKVFPPLLWIRIDSYGQSASYIVTFNSSEIFPAGFCGSNDYSLKLPRFMVHGQRMAAIRSRSQGAVSPAKSPRSPREADSPGKSREKNGELITLHVNPKCNCGPLMSPKKVISLPKSMGPGPVQLVLHCLITSLISCGTRPTKLLQLIGASGESPRSANWERVKIKAKLAGRRQMLLVDVVKNASQVPDFLRNICILCEACPNLITTEPYTGRCPDRCYLFIKPDLKNLQVRRRIPRNNTKDSLDDAQSSVDNSLDGDALEADLDDVKMDGEPVRITVGPGDFEDSSQTGFDEDMDTAADSQEPSRAASVELDEVTTSPAKNGQSSERPKRKATEARNLNGASGSGSRTEPPVRKRFRRGPPYAKADSGLRVPVPVSRPIDIGLTDGPPSPSSSDEERETFGNSRRQVAELVRMSMENDDSDADTENNPATNGRLVDDSEYLLHFFKHPRKWTVEETYSFLVRQLPNSEAPDILREEMIDGDALLLMVASDLRHLRIDSRDAMFVASLIERILFSIILTKGQHVPLYSNWK